MPALKKNRFSFFAFHNFDIFHRAFGIFPNTASVFEAYTLKKNSRDTSHLWTWHQFSWQFLRWGGMDKFWLFTRWKTKLIHVHHLDAFLDRHSLSVTWDCLRAFLRLKIRIWRIFRKGTRSERKRVDGVVLRPSFTLLGMTFGIGKEGKARAIGMDFIGAIFKYFAPLVFS